MKKHFTAGTIITWKQYVSKDMPIATEREGVVWSDAPSFEGEPGAFVWVIPSNQYPGEKSCIAVRVHRDGSKQGEAEVFEDALSYTQHSLKTVPK